MVATSWEFKSPHPHYLSDGIRPERCMIVLKISNASEVVASKVGRFLERLTPDSVDQSAVEDQVIKKMVENLAAEGLKGEIAAISGLDIEGDDLSLHKELKVHKHARF